jgi:hypothetical protein
MRSEIVEHICRGAPPDQAAKARALVGETGNIADQLVAVGFLPAKVLEAGCAVTGLPPAPMQWLRDPKVPEVDIDADLCRQLGAAPVAAAGGRLCIAYADPEIALQSDVLGFPPHVPYLALSVHLEKALTTIEGRGAVADELPTHAMPGIAPSAAPDDDDDGFVEDFEAATTDARPKTPARVPAPPTPAARDDDLEDRTAAAAAKPSLPPPSAPSKPPAALKNDIDDDPTSALDMPISSSPPPAPMPHQGGGTLPWGKAPSVPDDGEANEEIIVEEPAPRVPTPAPAVPPVAGKRFDLTAGPAPTAKPDDATLIGPLIGPPSDPPAPAPHRGGGTVPWAAFTSQEGASSPSKGAMPAGPATPPVAPAPKPQLPTSGARVARSPEPLDPPVPPRAPASTPSSSSPPGRAPNEPSMSSRPGSRRGGLQVVKLAESSLPQPRPESSLPQPRPESSLPTKRPEVSTSAPRPVASLDPFVPPKTNSGGKARPETSGKDAVAKGEVSGKNAVAKGEVSGKNAVAKGADASGFPRGPILAAAGAIVLVIVLVVVGPRMSSSEGPSPPLPAPTVPGSMDGALDLTTTQRGLTAQGNAEKDLDRAIQLFTEAIVMNPNAPGARDAFLGRAKAYLTKGDYEKAKADLQLLRRREDVGPIEDAVTKLLEEANKKRGR